MAAALSLSKIISSLVREFEKASVAADLSREYMREDYDSHPLLKETVPSRIRVSEASISIPLAFDAVGAEKTTPQEISKRQIRNLILSDKDQIPDKDQIASDILMSLKKKKRARLDNRNLVNHISESAKILIKDFKISEANRKSLETLQIAFRSASAKERESKFVYQTNELEKIQTDRIFKIDFKLVMD